MFAKLRDILFIGDDTPGRNQSLLFRDRDTL